MEIGLKAEESNESKSIAKPSANMGELQDFLDISDKIKALLENTEKVNKYTIYDMVYSKKKIEDMLNSGISNTDISSGLVELGRQLDRVLSRYDDNEIDKLLSKKVSIGHKEHKINKKFGKKKYSHKTFDTDATALTDIVEEVPKLLVFVAVMVAANLFTPDILEFKDGVSESVQFLGRSMSNIMTAILNIVSKVGILFEVLQIALKITARTFRFNSSFVNYDLHATRLVNVTDRYETARALGMELIEHGYQSNLVDAMSRMNSKHGMAYVNTCVDVERMYERLTSNK